MFWYEEDVKGLEKKQLEVINAPYTIFYGSSSIRLWKTLEDDFKQYNPINLGFGGSTLAACVWFFERVFAPYQPERIVLYAGDNDLGDGRKPEEVFICFRELALLINKKYGDIPCYFISLKPSFTRWNLVENFKYTNSLIQNEISNTPNNWHYINIYNAMLDDNGYPKKENLDADGLHLSPHGYTLWKQIVEKTIAHTEIKI